MGDVMPGGRRCLKAATSEEGERKGGGVKRKASALIVAVSVRYRREGRAARCTPRIAQFRRRYRRCLCRTSPLLLYPRHGSTRLLCLCCLRCCYLPHAAHAPRVLALTSYLPLPAVFSCSFLPHTPSAPRCAALPFIAICSHSMDIAPAALALGALESRKKEEEGR